MLRLRIWCCFLIAGGLASATFAADKSPPLPVRRVVLFTSGVAFVEHRGEVEGTQTIDLDFHVDDINDLLKSMVVQDEDGGRIQTITYTPQAPLAVTLGELKIDPSRIRSLGDLLQQLRGEKIQIDMVPNLVTGQIVAIDRRKAHIPPDQVIEQETLLIKTEAGLRNVPLASVASVKLLDEALDRDLQQALTLIASSKTDDKKRVSLHFQGEGKRKVRIGYIQEFPSGRPATAWCSTRSKSHSCKAGRLSKTPRSRLEGCRSRARQRPPGVVRDGSLFANVSRASHRGARNSSPDSRRAAMLKIWRPRNKPFAIRQAGLGGGGFGGGLGGGGMGGFGGG
jgi:hypothetical protein